MKTQDWPDSKGPGLRINHLQRCSWDHALAKLGERREIERIGDLRTKHRAEQIAAELPEPAAVSLDDLDRDKGLKLLRAALNRLDEPPEVKKQLKRLPAAQRNLIAHELLREQLRETLHTFTESDWLELRDRVLGEYPMASTYCHESVRVLALELMYRDAIHGTAPVFI